MEDAVTGARAEVALTVGMTPERVWELVTDVARMSGWSPECTAARWLTDGTPAAVPGARFEGRNRYPDGSVSAVLCVVTEAVRPRTFGWVVLDERNDPAWPASIWRYELTPAGAPTGRPGRTLVRHSFEHGPGATGARDAARRDPASLAGRLAGLRGNMAATLAAMAHGHTSPGATRHPMETR
jgi:uncharacterized protein YndB with AHSA1/START domain